jgi:hypothetical protein
MTASRYGSPHSAIAGQAANVKRQAVLQQVSAQRAATSQKTVAAWMEDGGLLRGDTSTTSLTKTTETEGLPERELCPQLERARFVMRSWEIRRYEPAETGLGGTRNNGPSLANRTTSSCSDDFFGRLSLKGAHDGRHDAGRSR